MKEADIKKRLKNISVVTESDIESVIRSLDGNRCVFNAKIILDDMDNPTYVLSALKTLKTSEFEIRRTKYRPANKYYPFFVHYDIRDTSKY